MCFNKFRNLMGKGVYAAYLTEKMKTRFINAGGLSE